jgi:hypothetical protein
MKVSEMILDMDAGFMANAFRLVDEQLETLTRIIRHDLQGEGDSPFLDDAEYLYGLGFVLGQRYLTSTCGAFKIENKNERLKAFSIGPQKNGIGTASVVNAVANYWKHSDEWDFDNLTKQQKETIAIIEKVGVKVRKYGGWVAANVLPKIGLKNFMELTPLLKTWSDAVEAAENSP